MGPKGLKHSREVQTMMPVPSYGWTPSLFRQRDFPSPLVLLTAFSANPHSSCLADQQFASPLPTLNIIFLRFLCLLSQKSTYSQHADVHVQLLPGLPTRKPQVRNCQMETTPVHSPSCNPKCICPFFVPLLPVLLGHSRTGDRMAP